jgi:hypothetical protein
MSALERVSELQYWPAPLSTPAVSARKLFQVMIHIGEAVEETRPQALGKPLSGDERIGYTEITGERPRRLFDAGGHRASK